MNKICGYSCEHNKSGVCQISICDKKTYMSDKTEIKHLSQSYYDLHEKYYKLQQENKQLKDNWNTLKEYIKETKLKEFEKSYGKRYGKTFTQAEVVVCNMILGKMQKIGQGSDSDV